MTSPKVTILLPSFNTVELTKLCLRSLRKYTDPNLIKVLVVDNGSQDASVEYLKGLSWISFFQRPVNPAEKCAEQHARSLDFLLEKVDTPYVLSIHTDTIMRRSDWLDFLLGKIENDPQIAGVGSWKLSQWSPLKKFVKSIEDFIRFKILFPLRGRHYDEKEQYHYLRSHCALYRTDLLRTKTRGFFDGMTAGKSMHKMLEDAGYRMIFLESEELLQYLNHFDHATMILNSDMFDCRHCKKKRAHKRIGQALKVPEFDDILADDSLDR